MAARIALRKDDMNDHPGRQGAKFAQLVFAGVLLLQALWIVSVPPFRGIDEFDHVYRAAGVTAGEWLLHEPAADGRGLVVSVPPEVVAAAHAQCAALEYTGRDNCYPIDSAVAGRVHVATAAGHYHPGFYAVVGVFASNFQGAAYDYALRGASALLCALGIALAAFVWTRGGSTHAERFGFLICLTPIFVYSSVMPAPNGIEMVAGLVVWCLLLRLGRMQARAQRTALVMAAIVACMLVTVRYLGPLWLGLSVLTVLVFLGWDAVRAVLHRHARLAVVGVAVVTAATASSVAWTLGAGLMGVGPQEGAIPAGTDVSLGAHPIAWLMQIVAAFPLRNDASPPTVYVLYTVVLTALVAIALAAGSRRQRVALLLAVLVIVALPIVMTLFTVRTHGFIWQGRYGLAYSVGLPLMASIMVSRFRGDKARREGPRLVLLGCAMLGIAHALAMASFVLNERNVVPSASDPAWLDPPLVLVVLVASSAWLVLTYAAARQPGSRERPVGAERMAAQDGESIGSTPRLRE